MTSTVSKSAPPRLKQAAETFGTGQERRTSGAKARRILNQFTARLKSCPDTKASFSAAAKQAAEKLALFEGYGLQAVHNCCVMNPALAAEGCYSSRNHPFSAACLGPEVRSFAETTRKSIPQGMKAS